MRTVRRALACVLALVPSMGQVWYPDLIFSGACDAQNNLNGLLFQKIGMTMGGGTGSKPYYKAQTAAVYMYYDPDCNGGGDGTGRWIVDTDRPDEGRWMDLDGDNTCNYLARIDSSEHFPPMAATWTMKCGVKWEDWWVALAPITSTSTSTTLTSTTSTTSTTISTTTTTITTTSTTTTRSVTSTTTTRSTTTTTTTTTSRTSTVTTSTTRTTTQTTTRTSTSSTRTATTSTGTGTSSTSSYTGTSSTLTTTSFTSTTRTSSTSTRTSSTVTTRTSSTSTRTTTTSTTLLVLRLSGACPYKDFLNGLTFDVVGSTASGAPYFKAREAQQYLYYDLDCNGGGNGAPRWILDADAPNASLAEDLDEDAACNYHARLDSEALERPPMVATWQIYCGAGWANLQLLLELVVAVDDDNATQLATVTGNPMLEAWTLTLQAKLCPDKGYLNGMQFVLAGRTAIGAPYYKAAGVEQYIYYDPSCGGGLNGTARWVIDAEAPDRNRLEDLDGDGACNYHARVRSEDESAPPAAAMWRVYCDGTWQDAWMIFTPRGSTTSTTTPVRTIVVNGVPGLRARLLTALLLPVALVAYSLDR